MKEKIIKALKVILPISVGLVLFYWFYTGMTDAELEATKDGFTRANYFWVIFSLCIGWLSHLSRAVRWRYLLAPMGYKVSIWQAYHCVMIGYIVNMAFPRAGEPTRAAYLDKSGGVPFEKGFGTIIIERVIDLVMLGGVFLLSTSLLNDKVDDFNKLTAGPDGEGGWLHWLVIGVGVIGVLAAVISKKIRTKLMGIISGVLEGLKSAYKTDKKVLFIVHTIWIWVAYMLMTWLGFLCLEETANVPVAAIFACFFAGAIAIVLVPGGIGIYIPMVASVLFQLFGEDMGLTGETGRGNANAIASLLWLGQTIMLIVLGLVSLVVMGRKKSAVPVSE